MQLRISVDDPSCQAAPYPVRWNRVVDEGAIQTAVWDRFLDQDVNFSLLHIPNYGTYHRLVVAADPALVWDEDAVLRVGDAIVRLVTGKIVGEHVAPLAEVETTAEGVTITSDWSQTVEREGRFIEIVAPGETHAAATLHASATLGLLAILFGDQAVGDVVFAEDYRAEPGERQAGIMRVPITGKIPLAVVDSGLDEADRMLGDIFASTPTKRASMLALHWYERGIRSRTALDELICYFIGIETIVNAFAAEEGGVPEVDARKKKYGPGLKKMLKGKVDDDTYNLLMRCLSTESTRDRFAFYVRTRGVDIEWINRFNSIARLRNSAFHGNPVEVDPGTAADAKRLLILALKQELGIALTVTWESMQKVVEFNAHYYLADHGYVPT